MPFVPFVSQTYSYIYAHPIMKQRMHYMDIKREHDVTKAKTNKTSLNQISCHANNQNRGKYIGILALSPRLAMMFQKRFVYYPNLSKLPISAFPFHSFYYLLLCCIRLHILEKL